MDNDKPRLSPAMNRVANPYYALQEADLHKTEAERRRESFMVKRQQPKPVLRPSHAMAHGLTRARFNQDWTREQTQARQDLSRAAFKEKRSSQSQARRTRTHDDH